MCGGETWKYGHDESTWLTAFVVPNEAVIFVLTMMFGVTDSFRTLFLRYSRRILASILANYWFVRIQVQSANDFVTYQKAIA